MFKFTEGVKMRGIKSETNGSVKPSKVVRDFSFSSFKPRQKKLPTNVILNISLHI